MLPPEPENHLPQKGPEAARASSALQTEFNLQLERINSLKAELAEKQAAVQTIRARVRKELTPLVQQLVAQRITYVGFLDQAYGQSFLLAPEQEKLAQLIQNIAWALLADHGVAEMRPLHEKYTAELALTPKGKAAAQARAALRETLKPMLGLEVDEDSLKDLNALQDRLDRLDRQMQDEQRQRDAERARRVQSKTRQAQEARQKTERETIGKATRRVYTALVKLLHPDKELDPNARAWKEEAIKKVTIAYGQDDFYGLLRLQIEFMDTQEFHLLPKEQLPYYVKLLQEQITALEEALAQFRRSPDARLYQAFGGAPKPSELKFRKAKHEVKDELKRLRQDLAEFQDPDFLAAYLRRLQL